jgi:hypothetical protein
MATADLRRHPRARASWRVAVTMGMGKAVQQQTIDVSPYGVKVKLDDSVRPGTVALLRLNPPDRQPLELQSVVLRSDPDGPVFVFVNLADDDLRRLKALVDDHRGA